MDFSWDSFWDVLLWSFWFFILISALFVWMRVIIDMFSDETLSGWAKAGWAILLIFLPWLGAFIYLIARGKSMTQRQIAHINEVKASQDAYIKSVAGSAASPAEQIKHAKELLDSGAVSPAEFEALKAKALS